MKSNYIISSHSEGFTAIAGANSVGKADFIDAVLGVQTDRRRSDSDYSSLLMNPYISQLLLHWNGPIQQEAIGIPDNAKKFMGVLKSFASRNPVKLAMLFEQIIQSDEGRKLYDEMENKKDAANTQFELAKKKKDNISMQLKEKCLQKRVAEKYNQMNSELEIQISKLKEEEILLQAELENTKNKSEDTELIQWLTDEKERLTHQLEASSVTPVITFCLDFEAVKDLEENLLQLKCRRHKLELRTRERQQKLEVINTLLDKYEKEKTEATDVIKNVNASIQQNEMSRSELEKQHYLLYKLKADKHESDTICYLDTIEDALKFHIQGVRGRIGKICTWDNGDNLAVTAALHRYKDFVVVEDKETEEKCIKHIKDRHLSPQRFLRLKPLKPISEDAKSLMLVRDLIWCDPACHNAIQFAVGNTIVCDDEAERNRYIAKGYKGKTWQVFIFNWMV